MSRGLETAARGHFREPMSVNYALQTLDNRE